MDRRIGPAPCELVSHLSSANCSAGNLREAQSAEAPEDFLRDIRAALDEMPDSVKRRLHGTLLGVYVSQGVGSSAVSDVVLDSGGKPIGFATVLDCEALQTRSANQWATWKENSPFAAGGACALEAIIEAPQHDNRKNALQYLLLHEFGHVLGAGNNLLPSWWIKPERYQSSDDYAFLPISWQIAMSGEIIPLLREDFALRKRIAYYSQGRLANGDMPAAYDALEQTGFASLYGATSVFEDFAESFASYVHSVLMQKPYEVRIRRDGEIVKRFKDYWSSARCTEKRRVLNEFLGGP